MTQAKRQAIARAGGLSEHNRGFHDPAIAAEASRKGVEARRRNKLAREAKE